MKVFISQEFFISFHFSFFIIFAVSPWNSSPCCPCRTAATPTHFAGFSPDLPAAICFPSRTGLHRSSAPDGICPPKMPTAHALLGVPRDLDSALPGKYIKLNFALYIILAKIFCVQQLQKCQKKRKILKKYCLEWNYPSTYFSLSNNTP